MYSSVYNLICIDFKKILFDFYYAFHPPCHGPRKSVGPKFYQFSDTRRAKAQACLRHYAPGATKSNELSICWYLRSICWRWLSICLHMLSFACISIVFASIFQHLLACAYFLLAFASYLLVVAQHLTAFAQLLLVFPSYLLVFAQHLLAPAQHLLCSCLHLICICLCFLCICLVQRELNIAGCFSRCARNTPKKSLTCWFCCLHSPSICQHLLSI